MPADRLLKLPDSLSCRTGAAMMLQGLTAAYLLRHTFPVKRGDQILIHAARQFEAGDDESGIDAAFEPEAGIGVEAQATTGASRGVGGAASGVTSVAAADGAGEGVREGRTLVSAGRLAATGCG